MRGPTLRLVCVNDVYSLENLPRLRTLVRRCATEEPADVLLTTLAGDFLAPSLLSSLDHGAGMVACLNAIPITHVCFGNHELDIPMDQLADRVRQFRGTWLNTNVPGYVPSPCTVSTCEAGSARSAWASSACSPRNRRSIAPGSSEACPCYRPTPR